MMSCLSVRELQGYLEDPGSGPRAKVERHLVECNRCRGTFDRMAATNHRVNSWLSALASPLESAPVDLAAAMQSVMAREERAAAASVAPDHISGLLRPSLARVPWYLSLERGLASLAIHLAVISLALYGFTNPQVQRAITQKLGMVDPNIRPYLPPKPDSMQGGGGGGARESAPFTSGRLPKPSMKQFVPPMITDHTPKLAMDPSIIAPPDTPLPPSNLNNWGDPLAKLMNGSNGNGFGRGMGNGSGGGVGNGNGGGFGPGAGGGIGGGVFKVGGGVSSPSVITRVDPEYSEEARRAKYSGTVVLAVIVDAEGYARDIHVVKSLGMGLDEKAVEAVQKWRFKPGMKGGVAVNVRAQIEVNFRLL